MMNRYCLTWYLIPAFLLFFQPRAEAQSGDVQEWPNGQVILANGDTLYGSVAYHPTEDIVRVIQMDGTVQAFTPIGIRSFTVTDKKGQNLQVFKPYFWNRGNDYSDYLVPAFFEQLLEGKYSLVKREIISFRNQAISPVYAGYGRYYDPYGSNQYTNRYQAVVLDLLYLYTPEKKIIALRNPKRDLEQLFANRAEEMRKFVRDYNLSYNNTRDIVRLIEYLNALN